MVNTIKKYGHRKIGQGWWGESHPHGLCAKGVKLGRHKTDYSFGKGVDYAKSWGNKDFRIDDHITVNCHGEDTRSGFRHICDVYRDGRLIGSGKATYLNRTWESYEFETAIKKALDNIGMSDAEKKKVLDRTSGKSREDTESQFKSVAMVASLGDIFGKTPKESNDWKARMIKAGLGNKGLVVPEDWDTLPEAEKEKRLNNVIKAMKEKPNYAKKGDFIDRLIAYESGELSENDEDDFLREVKSKGLHGQLQGHYGREIARREKDKPNYAYKLMYHGGIRGQGRGQSWDNKIYKTRASAIISMNKDKMISHLHKGEKVKIVNVSAKSPKKDFLDKLWGI